jgi:Swt1-like HEPN
MDYLDFLKSSPTLQILNQLNVPLAIAQKTASQIDAIQDSVAAVAAMKVPDHSWMRDMSEVTASWRNELYTWALQPTPAEKAIESLKKNLAAEAASIVAGWETSLAASAFEDSPTQRVLEAMKQDWDPIAKALKSAQEKWAVETDCFAKITDSWRKDLARESPSRATIWNSVQAAWALDTTRFLPTFEPPRMPKISLDSSWATPVFLERLEPPGAPRITPSNILARRPFNNYRMAESYDLLSDFERGLRDFIHRAMCEAFGMGWEKGRLPNGMYEEWVEKRQKARAAGESLERLIDYADFTDYVDIISRKDNWKEVFRSRLERREFVQESLHRLHSVRLCTMHSRILPHKMWQVLQTETLLLSDKMWN